MNSISRSLYFSVLAGLFFIPFISFIVINDLYFPYITGKAFVFRIVVEIVFGAWVLLALREPKYRLQFSWLLAFVALFVVSIGISNVLAIDSVKAFWSNFERMEGYVTLLHLFAYFCVIGAVLKTERLWSLFFHTWIGAGIFLSSYGILQIGNESLRHLSGERIDATLGNPIYLGIVGVFLVFLVLYYGMRNVDEITHLITSLLIGGISFVLWTFYVYFEALPLYTPSFFAGISHVALFIIAIALVGWCGYLLFKQDTLTDAFKRRFHMAGYSLLGILFFFIILNTGTRGALLGLFGGLSVSVLLLVIFGQLPSRIRKVLLGLIAVSVLLGSLLVLMVATNTIGVTQDTAGLREIQGAAQTVPGLERVVNIDLGERTVQSRFLLWGVAYNGFLEKPLLGWGQENFNFAFSTYYDPRLYEQEPWFDRVHNVFFDWLIAGGIMGVSLYFMIFAGALYALWRGPFSVLERSLLSGLFAAYLFQNMFVFDNLMSYILSFSVLAFIYATSVLERDIDTPYNIDTKWFNLATPILIVLLISCVYIINIRPIYTNAAFLDALTESQRGTYATGGRELYQEALSGSVLGRTEIRLGLGLDAGRYVRDDNVPQEVKSDIFVFAKEEFEKQINEFPGKPRLHVSYGYLFLSAGQLDEALKQFEKAHELSPKRQDVLMQIADVYVLRGDNQKAVEILRVAFDLEPNNKKARGFYASVALSLGDAEAFEYARTHEGELTDLDMALNNRVLNSVIATEDWDRVIELIKLRIEEQKRIFLEDPTQENGQHIVDSYVRLAGLYSNLGMIPQAIEALDEVEELFPEEAEQFEMLRNQIRG